MYGELTNYPEFSTHDNRQDKIDTFKFNNKNVRHHDRIKIISSNDLSAFIS
jgi:hypothetical protein